MFRRPFSALAGPLTALLAAAALAGCGVRREAAAPSAGIAIEPEYYAASIAALGFPGMSRAFQVGEGCQVGAGDGAFEWTLEGRDSARVSPVYFEADGVPVAHWWLLAGRDSIAFEAAAFRVGGGADTLLVASVRVTLPAGARLRLDARDDLRGDHFTPWGVRAGSRWALSDGRIERDGLVVGALTGAAAMNEAPARDSSARLSALSIPGAATLDFWFPDRPVSAADAERIGKRLRHDEHAARTRAAWREQLAAGASLVTPDARVNLAWRAALVTLLQGQERSAGEWVPMGNPFQYRDTWLRDGARVVRALAIAGFTGMARSDALSLARYQLPNGALLSQTGQLDGAGQALWAFEQAAGCPPSAEWAKRYLPAAARAGEWLRLQRVQSAMLAKSIRVDWPGLLPAADPRDAELVRAPLVGNDAWAIAGQQALSAMALRAGDNGVRAAALAESEAHRATFLAALARTRHPDVPPSWAGAGRDWGNIAVAWPTRVLPAEDSRLAAMAERVWKASGLHMMTYGPADTLHSYVGTDFGVWALLAGRPADARAVLSELLAHSSATLGQAEMFSRSSRGFGANLPPHGTAAAQLVDLLRGMVLLDARDTLEIAAGADLAWWQGTKLQRAPTRFGVVDLSLSQPAPGRLVARWSAVPAPVRVRVPDGVRLEADLTGRERWVDCRSGETSVILQVRPS